MGDLKRGAKRGINSVKNWGRDVRKGAKQVLDAGRTALGLKAPPEINAPVIPMPDEEEIRRNRRRLPRPSAGRASTILSDGADDFGLGG